MTRTTIPSILLTLLLLLSFSACDKSGEASGGTQGKPKVTTPPPPAPEQMIAKSWKLRLLNVQNQGPPPPQIMAHSSFNFYTDGRYEILLGDVDRGKWHLSPDKKVLITVPETGAPANHIDIEKLTPTELILTNNAGDAPVRMELVPQ
ncbi:MAG: hypothetical protein AAF570_27870 [Bacteroidota bacterium]